MGKDTAIAWCDHTFNPWWGCDKISPGCAHCYAETLGKRFGVEWGATEPRRTWLPNSNHWAEPLAWNRSAERVGVRKRVFCASMADVFDGRHDLDAQRYTLWDLIERTTWLDWLLLTKRPQNIHGMLPERFWHRWPANIWLGATVESERYVERALELCAEPGAVHFLSCEPLLGPVNVSRWIYCDEEPDAEGFGSRWVIVGGESGPGARPLSLDWVAGIVEQCRETGTPVFVKQLGTAWAREHGARDRHGADPAEWPEGLRVREFPQVKEIEA